ncbi:FolC bifunctional protein [Rhypophila decipiens]
MIDLGLARIGRLIQNTPQTWKAIHVAGTNGKGSICSYISAMLHASGVSCGRFNSPHLIDRWDCITVNEKPVSEHLFRHVENQVKKRDQDAQIGATEFELLTATAFEIFTQQKVDFGVIEVGLGGKLDATNALKQKSVTVISKIGLDHQSFLGSTLQEIALHKAGIMRRGVPCVVDFSNEPEVLKAIRDHAAEVKAELHDPMADGTAAAALAQEGFEPHQIWNLACARKAFQLACPDQDASWSHILLIVKQVQWPGRLQTLDIQRLAGRQQEVLLDGAHNTQSAEVLAAYVQKHLRVQGRPVTWVLAASKGKDMDGILGLLIQEGDQVAAVRFHPVDGMPWVKPEDPPKLVHLAKQHGARADQLYDAQDDVQDALTWASKAADGGPLVIAGSLYLVSSMSTPNHLIIVCGHAIWNGGPQNGWDESEWLIESYKKGETPTFIEHIKAGVKALAEDGQSVLVFSGGPTRKETPISEAKSYHNLAIANSYFNFLSPTSSATSRILLEERALDSYYNILFSLVLFWREHAVWPDTLTIVSHEFKRTRIVQGHCAAIGFTPLEERVRFIGVNPPGVEGALGGVQAAGVSKEKTNAMQGVQLTLGQWESDPHGYSEELAGKKRARNCWGVDQRLFFSEEERLRSGLETWILEDGTQVLVEGDARPWEKYGSFLA